MLRPALHTYAVITTGFILALAGCAESTKATKTFADPTYADSSFEKILVIGVAGDYSNRAAFERAMVSRIREKGAAATAYYTIIKNNEPLSREVVIDVVRSQGFDAVLLTRVISLEADASAKSGSAELKVSRKDDRAIDLFRYDYDVLNEPSVINISSTVTLSAEMFSAADETRLWASESTIADKKNVGQIIESAADTIMDQLKKDTLIDRKPGGSSF